MTKATRFHTQGPKVARGNAEHLTNTDLAGISSIRWSGKEMLAAMDAFMKALSMDEAAKEAWMRKRFGTPAERQGMIAETMPFPQLHLSMWMNDRYRAHAPMVGNYHLVRFMAAHVFLAEHHERLISDRLVDRDEEGGIAFSRILMSALAMIHYADPLADAKDPGASPVPVFRYEDVLGLAKRIGLGEERATEFKRTAYKGEGSEVYEVDYEDERPPMPLNLFSEGLAKYNAMANAPDEDWDIAQARLEERSPKLAEAGITPMQMDLMAWLAGQSIDTDTAMAYTNRIMTSGRFIDEHAERLEQDGLLLPEDDGFLLTPELLKTLNLMRLEVPRGAEEITMPRYEAVLRVAREMGAAGPRPTQDHRATPSVGRNDPCPCGSGRKYKKCHGSAVH